MTEADILKAALRHTAHFDPSADASAFVDNMIDDLVPIIKRFAPKLSRFEIELALAALRTRRTEALADLVADLAHQAVTEAYDFLAIQDEEIPAQREYDAAITASKPQPQL